MYREDEVQEWLRLLYEHPEVELAVDTETTGLKLPGRDHGIGVSVATVVEGKPVSFYVGLFHETGENASPRTVDMLRWVLRQEGRKLIFANVLFDLLSLSSMGIDVEHQEFWDVQVMAHLIDENQPFQGKELDVLGQHYLKSGKVVDEFVEAEKKSGNHNITVEQMWLYAVTDAQLTYRLWKFFMAHKRWVELNPLIWEDKQKLVRGPLLAMKRRGVRIDQALAYSYVVKGEAEQKRLAAELGFPAKPTKKNPDPLPVLGSIAMTELFIDRLGLPVIKSSEKTGKPSFDKEVMAEYDAMLERIDSPEAKTVKQYRGWQKAVSAAYRPYLNLVDDDGRLRCSYKLHGTVTGRFSCSEPNLQQVPKETDKPWNGRVKECFVPDDGFVLINADFSQLELRLATAYSNEQSLKEVFLEGRDIFTEMAALLGWERHNTKTFVYSVQYGAGVNRIMSAFGVDERQAKKMIEDFYRTYPRFRLLNENTKERAEAVREIKMWTGRARHFKYRSDGYKAMNSLIQGGAADIVERIMVRCYELLDSDDCRMLLQVHDSITWEVRKERVEEMMPKIKAVMEDVKAVTDPYGVQLDVKFAVDVGFWTEREAARLELAA